MKNLKKNKKEAKRLNIFTDIYDWLKVFSILK